VTLFSHLRCQWSSFRAGSGEFVVVCALIDGALLDQRGLDEGIEVRVEPTQPADN